MRVLSTQLVRTAVALAFGLATLLCCCQALALRAAPHQTAQELGAGEPTALNPHACCTVRQTAGQQKADPEASQSADPSPAGPDDSHQGCPLCSRVVGLAPAATKAPSVAAPELLPPILAPPTLNPALPGDTLLSTVRPEADRPPGPTLISLHTCLLC